MGDVFVKLFKRRVLISGIGAALFGTTIAGD